MEAEALVKSSSVSPPLSLKHLIFMFFIDFFKCFVYLCQKKIQISCNTWKKRFMLYRFVFFSTVLLINLFMPQERAVICHDADGLLINIITLVLTRTARNHTAFQMMPTKIWWRLLKAPNSFIGRHVIFIDIQPEVFIIGKNVSESSLRNPDSLVFMLYCHIRCGLVYLITTADDTRLTLPHFNVHVGLKVLFFFLFYLPHLGWCLKLTTGVWHQINMSTCVSHS